MSVGELSALSGVSTDTLHSWMMGRRAPRVPLLEAALNVYGLTMVVQPLTREEKSANIPD